MKRRHLYKGWGTYQKPFRELFRRLIYRVEDFVVGRPEYRHHDLAKTDDALSIYHDYAAPRADQILHVIIANGLALGIRKKPHGQIVIRREAAVLLYRVGVDADDFRAGLLIARPVVAHAAQLFGADRRLVARVEKQRDYFAPRASQRPSFACAVGEINLRRQLAYIWSCGCHSRSISFEF